MLHKHTYETITLFLTGVGFGIYLYELRRFCNRIHPSSIHRSARRTKTTKQKETSGSRIRSERVRSDGPRATWKLSTHRVHAFR